MRKSKDHSPPSNLQKAVGLLIIIGSIALGLYLMDRYPGMQAAWSPEKRQAPSPIDPEEGLKLLFLKDWSFSTGTKWQGYEVGGLSALAYNPHLNQLLTLSDDRGGKGDPRFFSWSISFEGQVDIALLKATPLKSAKKKVFEERVIDPEGIVWLSETRLLVSSEGEQEARPHQPPRLMLMNEKGEWLKDIPVSSVFWNQDEIGKYGVRNNMAFEALTADPTKRWIYLSTESALIQDGPVADFEQGSVIRIVEYDREGDELQEVAQLPYKVEPIPIDGAAAGGLEVGMNGVSDFLALGQRRFLVMERSYIANRGKNINRIYFADCLHATDVKQIDALMGRSYDACKKKLVLEFDSVLQRLTSGHARIDNLEGMVLWKDESGGRHYVMFVADNNFRSEQSNQFMLFELKGWDFNAL